MSFDVSTFDRLLATLGRGDDAPIRIGWASHEADFKTTLAPRSHLRVTVEMVMEKRMNTYFEINPSTHQGKGRTAANEVTQLVALWADIDFKGGGMGSPEQAKALIDELSRVLGGEPAAIVSSGGGCQPYWLLDGVSAETYGIDTISALSKRWGSLVKRLALELGGGADGVFDLARVFRIPGTFNFKYDGEPRPVTVEFFDEPQSWTLEEITDILDDWGVPEPDTGLNATIVSSEAEWKWADEDCNFVATAREEIASSEPVARHQWMLKWSALLYGMIRNGCIREESFYELRDLLVERFRWICEHAGTPRTPGDRELNDAFVYGQRRAQMWEQDKLDSELRQHVHRDFDEQFAWMQAPQSQPVAQPVLASLPPLPNTGAILPQPIFAEPPAPLPAGEVDGGDVEPGVPAVATAPEVPAPAGLTTLAALKPQGLDRMKVAPRTDTGNAERLARKFVGEFIFVPGQGWLRFDGARYALDEGAHTIERAKDVFMALFTTGSTSDQKWALKSLGAGMLSAALKLAQSTPEMLRMPITLDTGEYDFCTPGGVVDLRTGTIRPADPTHDLNTRIAAVTPDFSAPPTEFLKLLAWMQPDPDIQSYLQRVAGIALLGNLDFQIFPIFVGPGANGKTTLTELLAGVMGEYAATMPRKFLVESPNNNHPTEIAQLQGLRFGINNEVPASARFDEDFLKAITGERELRARFIGGNFFKFKNTCLHIMTANHLPSVAAGGPSIWRRVRLIPFRARVAPGAMNERLVPDLLESEGPQILAWMIEGARQVIAHGEQVPKQVQIATDQYKFEEDAIARFISQRLVPIEGMGASRDVVYSVYRTWVMQEGLNPLQRQKFEREVLTQLPEAASDDLDLQHVFAGYSIVMETYTIPEAVQ